MRVLLFLLTITGCVTTITAGKDSAEAFGSIDDSRADADADTDADTDADADTDTDADTDADTDTDTDPDSDNDGDGWTNAEESAAGTNPNYAYSHPYTGGYNVGFCSSPPAATGPTEAVSMVYDGATYTWDAYGVGDVLNNFSLRDQHGEMVDLYSFCGRHVVITISAGWCGPCRTLAAELQSAQNSYRDSGPGVQFIEIITQDNSGNPPSQAFLREWASDYGFTDIPVLGAEAATSYEHVSMLFDRDGYIPSIYQANSALQVVHADGGNHNPGSYL
jgi:thiol-disulfide isomerase/thioredoxin